MFEVKETVDLVVKPKSYLSFPDIIKSPKADNRFFIVYREGNSHHPTWSKLSLLISEDGGQTWDTRQEFPLRFRKDGFVWNCPRLSYVDNILYIVCDQKSSVFERIANFKTSTLTSTTEGYFFRRNETTIPGMLPDKLIKFKDKLLCANHFIKSSKNDLIQLVSWSRDNGKTWFDTNIVANSPERQYCEASIVNVRNDHVIAYLRDNSGHKKHVYYTSSKDGIHWGKIWPLPNIYGQRVTAIIEGYDVIGAYRNTESCKISIFEHDIENHNVKSSDIDWEYLENQYHFGYTGIAKVSENQYLVVYYIKQDRKNPFIKLAFVERKK